MNLIPAVEASFQTAEMVGIVNPVLIIPVFAFTFITVSALKIRQRAPQDKNWIIPLVNVGFSVALTWLTLEQFSVHSLVQSSLPLAGITSITYDLVKNIGIRAKQLISDKVESFLKDRLEGGDHE